MNDQLVIANGVTPWTLNPHNMALKNNYWENLMATAFTIFPRVTPVTGDDREIIVKRGFQSHAYIMQEVDPTADSDLLKHAKGMAIEFTWKDCNEDELMLVASSIYEGAQDPVKIVVDIEKHTVYVSRGVNFSTIVEKTFNESRVIRKAA